MHFYTGCHVLSLQIVLLYSQTLVVISDVQTKLVQAEAVNSAANCCRSLYTSILTKDVCELAYAKYKPQ